MFWLLAGVVGRVRLGELLDSGVGVIGSDLGLQQAMQFVDLVVIINGKPLNTGRLLAHYLVLAEVDSGSDVLWHLRHGLVYQGEFLVQLIDSLLYVSRRGRHATIFVVELVCIRVYKRSVDIPPRLHRCLCCDLIHLPSLTFSPRLSELTLEASDGSTGLESGESIDVRLLLAVGLLGDCSKVKANLGSASSHGFVSSVHFRALSVSEAST